LCATYAGLPKLNDANNAGTKHSEDCTLILTEGDSAMSLAVAGLAVIGRDSYGVFPLRCVFHACIKQEHNDTKFGMYEPHVTWQQHVSSTQPNMSWLQLQTLLASQNFTLPHWSSLCWPDESM